MMSSPIGYIITSPLSGWITHTFGWRYIFIIEGLLTVVLVALWWPLIEDKPEQAKWLSVEERDLLVRTLHEEQQHFRMSTTKSASYRTILSNFNLWRLSVIYFCYLIGSISYVIWLPTLIKLLTKTNMATVGLLTAVPYIAAIGGLYIFGSRADRTGNRRLYAALPGILMALCLLLATQTKEWTWVSYAFLTLCGFFQMAHNGPFWAIPPLLFPMNVAGGARGIINGIANLGGFVGPSLVGWFITKFHSPDIGIYVLCASLL
jgi:sugar phosphate permease